jgi:hypothetical protein
MFKTTLRNVAVTTAISLLACAAGGCATALTPDSAIQDTLDLLLQSAESAIASGASQTDKSSSSAVQDTVASAAGQLLQELQTVLAGQDPGSAGSTLLTALSDVAGQSLTTAASQTATSAHPFRQLRAEIHTLRHSMTKDQAAQVLLSALAASSTTGSSATTGTSSSTSDLLTQVQNLLASLRATNP